MGTTFDIDKIFETAKNIELDSAKFYREAADKASNNKVKQVLFELADMEDGHIRIFEEIRNSASKSKDYNLFAADNDVVLYLQNMADSTENEGMKSPLEKLTGTETIEEILEIAIETEKATLLFYTGLKELLVADEDKDKIESIIKEEFSHLVVLNMNLTVLG